MHPSDDAILRHLGEILDRVDPLPTGLVDQVCFAIDLTEVDAELMRLTEIHGLATVRGDTNRMVTFDGEQLTIMVSLAENHNATLRLDGWLTPAASHLIELRSPTGIRTTNSDDTGRFAFDQLPHGMTTLVVRPDDGTRTVTTPAMDL
jgi:hypothetical protein